MCKKVFYELCISYGQLYQTMYMCGKPITIKIGSCSIAIDIIMAKTKSFKQ